MLRGTNQQPPLVFDIASGDLGAYAGAQKEAMMGVPLIEIETDPHCPLAGRRNPATGRFRTATDSAEAP